MIQDIKPHVFHNEYQHVMPQDKDFVLCYDGNTILLNASDEPYTYEKYIEYAETKSHVPLQYLFSLDGNRYFLANALVKDENRKEHSLDEMRLFHPRELAFLLETGWHLYRWYLNNRYCGRCGRENVPDEQERALHCPHCNHSIYPTIAPAVIVAVRNGDKLLLTRYAANRKYQKYALIAGFTEIGETVEETVAREVMEEAGLEVTNITYYKSQPWGFTNTILLGFFADLKGSDEIHMDPEELSEAVWMDRADVPLMPEFASLTQEMMETFHNGEDPK